MAQLKITQSILDNLILDYQSGMTPKQMSDKYNINAGTIISKLQSIGVYKNKNHRFTRDDLQYLQEHYPKDNIEDILMHFPNVSKKQIIVYCSKHKIPSKYKIHSRWSENDLEVIKKYYYDKTIDEIYNMIDKRHTKDAITTKALKYFGYSKDRTWTDEEISIMNHYYIIESVDELLNRLPKRTRGAIIDKAMQLGLRNYTKILFDWTEEQEEFLINNWKNMSDSQIAERLGRSSRSVRDKRHYFGFMRTVNHYNKATYENLNKYLRGNTWEWKSNSMKNCNYQCILTGSKDFAIHHLYSFSSIVNEVLEENNFELKDSFSDYTEDELIFILNRFIEKQSQYPLGVCIRKDLHDLFHREYGTVVTPDMWYDFVENYKKGKYIN